jgi:hypothetical protein
MTKEVLVEEDDTLSGAGEEKDLLVFIVEKRINELIGISINISPEGDGFGGQRELGSLAI